MPNFIFAVEKSRTLAKEFNNTKRHLVANFALIGFLPKIP